MLRYLPLLLRLRAAHFRLAGGLAAGGLLGTSIVGGGWAFGWKGAVLTPLATLLVLVVLLHVTVRLAVALGLRLYEKGQYMHASGLLWLTQVPWLKAYDRKGKVSKAFTDAKARMGMEMLQRFAREGKMPF